MNAGAMVTAIPVSTLRLAAEWLEFPSTPIAIVLGLNQLARCWCSGESGDGAGNSHRLNRELRRWTVPSAALRLTAGWRARTVDRWLSPRRRDPAGGRWFAGLAEPQLAPVSALALASRGCRYGAFCILVGGWRIVQQRL